MKLEGVPEGYEAVRFGVPEDEELFLATTGEVVQSPGRYDGPRLVVRKREPAGTWIRGVFTDGFVAEDQNGDQFWYSRKPVATAGDDSWAWPDKSPGKSVLINPITFLCLVKFRDDLPWSERIVAVGPAAEGEMP